MSQDIVIRFDERAMVIMDPGREWVFSADPLGRIAWVYTPEIRYRRSRLDQWYVVKRRRWTYLEPADRADIEQSVEKWTAVWKQARLRISGTSEQKVLSKVLDDWIHGFLASHRDDAERFRSIYQHIPILPPDAYQALYVQVSRGCPWNRCTFCSFYRDRDYRVPSEDELDRHLASVRSYWEGAQGSRRGLFLGDANAIAIPADALAERMKRIRSVFPEKPLRSFHAFADFISGRVRSSLDFEGLRRLGLNRICFGVESGNTELMERIQKPVCAEDVLDAVRAARDGGVAVSLIFVIGVGGRRYRDVHFEDSIQLLSRLPLEGRDRIYLSPLTLETDFGYTEIAEDNDWGALTNEDIDLEMNRWKEAIAQRHTGVSVSLYNIRHFSY
jgi:radical SAM superfamily enzyme YgiQ (UPF0313 family)